jgi:hypothetical protein
MGHRPLQEEAPADGAKYPGAHSWQALAWGEEVKEPGGQGVGAEEAGGQKKPGWQGRGFTVPVGQKKLSGHSPVQLEEVSPCSIPKRPGGQALRCCAVLQ